MPASVLVISAPAPNRAHWLWLPKIPPTLHDIHHSARLKSAVQRKFNCSELARNFYIYLLAQSSAFHKVALTGHRSE
jgi:hypothetical protein